MAGTFLLLGSGEFEPWSHEVEDRALRSARGDGSVLVLPTASATEGDAVFDRWANMGLVHYAEAGVRAECLPVKTRDDALRPDLAARAETASMVFFSGGKPDRLAAVLGGTPLLAAIGRAMDRGAVYAGCSAGAMVASQSREQRNALGEIGTAWLFGLGLIEHASFGVHWDRVRRIPGVAWWSSSRLPDGTWFVGIEEQTAIFGDGASWEVAGLRNVDVRGPGNMRATYRPGETFVLTAGADG